VETIVAIESLLHGVTARDGAVFTEEAGWRIPEHFGEPAAEYAAACEAAVLFDRSHSGKIEATGPEASRFLHNLCTNDVAKLEPGTGCAAYLTTGQAKIVASALIFRPPLPVGKETYQLDVGPGMGPKVVSHLDRHLISERLELADRTLEYAQVHLAGPVAAGILAQAFGKTIDLPAQLTNRAEMLGSIACQVRRNDALGLPGFDIVWPAAAGETVWSALLQAGARPAGMHTYHVLRVEAGTPQYNLDIDETNLPQEVGRIEYTISFTKGCYIGQETVARIRTYGHVNRSLCGLLVAGDTLAPHGAKIIRNGQEVGTIGSSVLSPRLKKVIALAYLRRGHQHAGTCVEIEAAGTRLSAEVTGLPFVPSIGVRA
jgi:aminomethyltransferase